MVLSGPGVDAAGASGLPVATSWANPAGLGPERPASCTAASSTDRFPNTNLDPTRSSTGTAPWPARASGDPSAYGDYLATPIDPTKAPLVPSNWTADGSDWKLGAERVGDATQQANPQELCGVAGASADLAWQHTTGNPTTVIAVLDSGIEWCDPTVVDKIALNRAGLPAPQDSAGKTKAEGGGDPARTSRDADPYDLLGIGVLNVEQYAADPRVAAVEAAYGGTYCASQATGYTGISAEDLIRTFGRPTLPGGGSNERYYGHDGPAGFTEAIAGWNFVDNSNDPVDDVAYGHGTGEAGDMAGAANSSGGGVGACPSCMVMPVRVGTSFIATGNAFAQGVAFAVDSGATIISEALGTLDQTPSADQAIAYASAHGVPIVGSAADEESEHANLPAGASNQVIDVNSATPAKNGLGPSTQLLLNGCTNYGANIAVTVESASCSSEATGKAAGVVGLVESEAANLLAAGKLAAYPGLSSGSGQAVALSANEVYQLVTQSADDVDFTTPATNQAGKVLGPARNFALTSPSAFGLLGVSSRRHPTKAGYDLYSGYGRLNAARAVARVAASASGSGNQIPPEALITSPGLGSVVDTSGELAVEGRVAAVRSSSYRWQLQVAVGAAPGASAWHELASGSGTSPREGQLADVDLAQVAALFPGGAASLTGPAQSASGVPQPDRFTFTLRLVTADAAGLLGMSRATLQMHHDASAVAGLSRQLASSVDAPVKVATLQTASGPVAAAVVAEADGTVHAFDASGAELPGWAVTTAPLDYHAGEAAFSSGAIDPPHGEIIGGVAVGDLLGNGQTEVVASDYAGRIYAWDGNGKLLAGWPVSSNPAFSASSARDRYNRLLPGFLAAPALADLAGNGKLEVVAAGMDRHVYAFTPDGQALAGWPVLVVDPAKVAAVDPVSNHVTFTDPSSVAQGSELVATPAIGALAGSGPPDVVVSSTEEYYEPINASFDPLMQLILDAGGYLKHTANARLYALAPGGSTNGPDQGAVPGSGAYLPGWPAKLGDLEPGLLPTIGDGATASPALARLGRGQALSVVASSTAGPLYVLKANGSSKLGTSGGVARVLAQSSSLPGLSNLVIPALGGPTVAPLGRGTSPLVLSAVASVGRLLDQGYPGQQTPGLNGLGAWSPGSGAMAAGFPGVVSDLQFLTYPVVAAVAGPSAGGFAIQASGLADLRAYGASGQVPAGWPKFTGGWAVGSAAVGALRGGNRQLVLIGTRQGRLWAWTTKLKACQRTGPWPSGHHDLANSSNLAAALPPSSC